MMNFSGTTAIVGIGATEFSKASGRSELHLAIEACVAALDDAGVEPRQVQGLSTFTMDTNPENDVMRALGISELTHFSRIHFGGRVRFTQAHELGHYILHRRMRDSFQCSDGDMLNWSQDDRDIEGQADVFASYLLMPLDDYRKQITGAVNLDMLGHCAEAPSRRR